MSQLTLDKSVKHSLFSLIGTITSFVVMFALAGYRIRFLGIEKVGYLMLLETVLTIAQTIGGAGFGTAATQKMATLFGKKDVNGIKNILSTIVFIGFLLGILIFCIYALSFELIFKWSRLDVSLYNDAHLATIFVGATFMVTQMYVNYEELFPSLHRFDLVSYVKAFFSLISGVAGLIILSIVPTMTAISVTFFIISVIRLLTSIIICSKLLNSIVLPQLKSYVFKDIYKFGLWNYAGAISNLLISSLDKVVLTSLFGAGYLSYYVIGQRVVSIVHSAISGQTGFLFPTLATEINSDHNMLRLGILEDKLRWFIGFLSSIFYGLILCISYPFLKMVIGSDFASVAYIPFSLACIQGFFMAQNITSYRISWALGQGAPNALFEFFTGVIVLASILLLSPSLGVIGVSLSRLWVGPTTVVLICWVMKISTGFSFYRLLRPVLTPLLIFIILIISTVLFKDYWDKSYFMASLSVLVSLLIACSVGISLELNVFKKYKCILTLKQSMLIAVKFMKRS